MSNTIPLKFEEEIMFEREVEQNRAQMHNRMDECVERIHYRKQFLNQGFDDLLAEHRKYLSRLHDDVKKQQTCPSIKRIKEISESIHLLKPPTMLKFECETNIVFSQIDKIGKLVEKLSIDINDDGTKDVGKEVEIIPNNEISPSHPYYAACLSNKFPRHCNHGFQVYDEIHFTDNPADKYYNHLSMTSPHSLFIDGRYWDSVYQYFRAHKSNYPRSITDEELISYWDAIMMRALTERYRNRSSVLFDTAGKIIYECKDIHWGIGEQGNGENRLGLLLMTIRDRSLPRSEKTMYIY